MYSYRELLDAAYPTVRNVEKYVLQVLKRNTYENIYMLQEEPRAF
jgi:hypothetical protein